ncbi:MAG: DUF348 domain-containing protein [Caldilineae bacterium]|nr:MAG: DUF348 domain-containing protein [Caldilineae bacterium]
MSGTSTTSATRTILPPIARPRAVTLALLLALLAVMAAGWQRYRGLIPITIVVDDEVLHVQTAQRDAAAALAALGYRPHPNDYLNAPGGPLQAGAQIVIRLARPFVVRADGREQELWLRADTVGQALHAMGIAIGREDRITLEGKPVTPDTPLPPVRRTGGSHGPPLAVGTSSAGLYAAGALFPWQYRVVPLHIAIERAIPFTLIDGKALPATVYTHAQTVAQALDAEQVPLYEGDTVFPPLSSRLQPGMLVTIRRATPVTILADGQEFHVRTQEETVAAVLVQQGIVVMGLDRVEPDLGTRLRPHMQIRVTRVREQYVYEDEIVPFESIMLGDDTLLIDQRRVKSQGRNGLRRYRYRVRYEDGQEVARTLEDSWIAVEPETRVIAYGRKIVPQTLETPNGTITYWRKIRMYATSYSPKRSGTPRSAPWYGRTRLGKPLRKGIVAVDPAVVNLRQELYVPGYGLAIAGDTGSGVKGKHIDLGYSDWDYRSWHWWVDVYLLWPPPPPYAINYLLPNWPQYPDRGR